MIKFKDFLNEWGAHLYNEPVKHSNSVPLMTGCIKVPKLYAGKVLDTIINSLSAEPIVTVSIKDAEFRFNDALIEDKARNLIASKFSNEISTEPDWFDFKKDVLFR